ncbi:unnamed protein product (macronuclear) [Paramecium tetraurelia]|uniref:Protein kinase domain-containing protein n=1 Tax=Paramecium tetraurelia TaxID=5888 RepID=A0DMP4_PARTE|nr:uncharacterized protein GSPATT00018515001 [Paramecium tetraurelia]CAK84311.1 unnamed protein product [Paramecium tetraurelia]|eukprot:XP_001451708.1 hypothetical protein (macronuclear) [Paramecium tetraurelia strain d4-2]
MKDVECLYRNKAILEEKVAQRSSKQVLVEALCDDLDAFLEYESQITGQYLRSQNQVIGRKQYSFLIPEGVTLLQFIQQNGKLSTNQISQIYEQLLQALYQIHLKFSLGRCFHIGNIYYQNNSIQMAAFGFYPNLQLIPPESLEKREQSQNRDYGQSIDVWLIGCIIYQLFTGEVLNNFMTIKEYRSFYNQIQSLQIENDWKNRLINMLNPIEAQRCTFFSMHHEISNNNQEEVREFYKTIFLSQNYSQLIKIREQIDDNFIEWAVPKEFTKQMELPKVLNPFRTRIQLCNPPLQKQENPYPRIGITAYYSQPILPIRSVDPYPNPSNPSPLNDYPDLVILPYKCRNQTEFNQYKDIWVELHFESYKWYLMNSLKEQLEEQQDGNPAETWSVYCLLKMSILMRKEFIDQWSTKILDFEQEKWQNFITSGQAKKFIKDLGMQLDGDSAIINSYFKKCQFNQLSREDEHFFNQIKPSITESIVNETSNDFKIPYRMTLKNLYRSKQRSSNNDAEQTLLALKIIICMGISSLFLSLKREILFRQVKRTLNIPNFDNPYYLEEQFFSFDSNILNEQIRIIETEYFKS